MTSNATPGEISQKPRPLVAVAGWLLISSLVLAPWAFGSRPYFWNGILAVVLSSSGVLWLVGSGKEWRALQLPASCLLALGFIAVELAVSLLNPRSYYDPISGDLQPLASFKVYLPSTVDVGNSLPFAVSLASLLLAMVLAAGFSSSTVWRERMVTAMALAGISVIGGGLLLKAGITPQVSAFLIHRPWASGDIFGPFDYHGNAATFINLVIPAMALKAGRANKAPGRGLWLAALCVSYLAALTNTSRAGLVITLAASPAIVWIVRTGWNKMPSGGNGRRAKSPMIPAILALMVVAVSVLLLRGGSKAIRRLSNLRSDVSVPWYPRFQQSRAAWEMMRQRPWFGAGIGSYKLLVQYSGIRGNFFAPTYRPGEPYTVLSNTHDDYLQTLAEWGWVGMLGWIALVGGAFAGLWRFLKGAHAETVTALGSAVALGSVFVHAVVDCPLQIPALQLFTAVYLGFGYGCARWPVNAGATIAA